MLPYAISIIGFLSIEYAHRTRTVKAGAISAFVYVLKPGKGAPVDPAATEQALAALSVITNEDGYPHAKRVQQMALEAGAFLAALQYAQLTPSLSHVTSHALTMGIINNLVSASLPASIQEAAEAGLLQCILGTLDPSNVAKSEARLFAAFALQRLCELCLSPSGADRFEPETDHCKPSLPKQASILFLSSQQNMLRQILTEMCQDFTLAMGSTQINQTSAEDGTVIVFMRAVVAHTSEMLQTISEDGGNCESRDSVSRLCLLLTASCLALNFNLDNQISVS